MNTTDKLKSAKAYIEEALSDLEDAPEKETIIELLDSVARIDSYYKESFCAELDLDYDEEPGTTYENGISLEFYIEADWWDDVSKAFRKLRPPEEE